MLINHLQFRCAKYDKRTNEIFVYVKNIDYKSEIAKIQNAIEEPGLELDYWECGVNIHGEFHGPGVECPNSRWNTVLEDFHCPIQHSRALRLREDVYTWLPAMIECYWQNGIKPDDAKFLEAGNFVTLYRYAAPYNSSSLI